MENKYHIVNFAGHCPLCKHSKKKESEDPCNDCLAIGANINTTEPVKFENRGKGGKKRAKRGHSRS